MPKSDRLYKHLPDIYDDNASSDQYKVMEALATFTDNARTNITDFREDLSVPTSDGDGLSRLGENFGIPRPPGMVDVLYRALILAITGIPHGTIYCIKAVFEAATGLTATVEDQQSNAVIPDYEIWITVSGGVSPSYGRAMFPGLTTNYDGHPVESSVAGAVHNDLGYYGGLYNDHPWGPVDIFTARLIDKVRPAGTKIIYRG